VGTPRRWGRSPTGRNPSRQRRSRRGRGGASRTSSRV
jgi:hypothetical protein